MSMSSTKRARIGIYPADEQISRRNLFAALETAYPIGFEGREAGQWSGLDALLILGPETPPAMPPALPVLQALGEERRLDSKRTLTLSDDAALARPLRSAQLTDGWVPTLEGGVWRDCSPIAATVEGMPRVGRGRGRRWRRQRARLCGSRRACSGGSAARASPPRALLGAAGARPLPQDRIARSAPADSLAAGRVRPG